MSQDQEKLPELPPIPSKIMKSHYEGPTPEELEGVDKRFRGQLKALANEIVLPPGWPAIAPLPLTTPKVEGLGEVTTNSDIVERVLSKYESMLSLDLRTRQGKTQFITELQKIINTGVSSYPELSGVLNNPQERAKLEKEAIKNIGDENLRLRLSQSEEDKIIQDHLRPVMDFLGANSPDVVRHKIVVLQHPRPIIYSTAGVLIVITTGAIFANEQQTKVRKSLAGMLGHEIAHKGFLHLTIPLLKDVINNPAASEQQKKKAIQQYKQIELECDLIGALTMEAYGLKADEYRKFLEELRSKYPNEERTPWAPSLEERTYVVQRTMQQYAQGLASR